MTLKTLYIAYILTDLEKWEDTLKKDDCCREEDKRDFEIVREYQREFKENYSEQIEIYNAIVANGGNLWSYYNGADNDEYSCVSDLHWYTDAELAKIKNVDFDVCVLLGDIPVTAIRQINAYTGSKPVLAVVGNHDDWNTPELGGAENIHGRCVEHCGYSFAGFSGSARYKYGDYPMFTQRESLKLGNKLQKADILLSHDSMYHLICRDKPHSGLLGIDLYNLKNRVKLNICGHHHTPIIKKRFGTTTVCVFRCAVITFPNVKVENIF